MVRLDSLTPIQLDALREVGGIGSGHAATALSQLVDRRITLEVPRIEIVEFSEVPQLFGGPERLVGAVYSRILGDINGAILFMVDRTAALALVDMMHGHEVGTAKSLGHDEEALLRHVASILISAYVAAIGRLADLEVLPSSPSLAFDMAGALLQTAVAEIGVDAEQAFLVRASFIDKNDMIEAALFFAPYPDSLSVLLGRLGMA